MELKINGAYCEDANEQIGKVDNLVKFYNKKTALDGITANIPKDRIVGLIGKNGSGKTTLLKILAGRTRHNEGDVIINGQAPYNNLEVLKDMLLLDSNYYYGDKIKIKDIFKKYSIMFDEFDMDFALKILDVFEISPKNSYTSLSQGMRAVVNLTCALACRVKVILLDEPLIGMDTNVRKRMCEILLKEQDKHPRTFIISSHLLNELEGIITDVLLINEGKVVLQSTLDDIYQQVYKVSGDEKILQEFCEGKNIIYKNEGSISSFAVINEEINEELEKEIKNRGLSAKLVKIEELLVYVNDENKGENVECLWN